MFWHDLHFHFYFITVVDKWDYTSESIWLLKEYLQRMNHEWKWFQMWQMQKGYICHNHSQFAQISKAWYNWNGNQMHVRLFLPKPNIIFGSYEMGWTVDNLNVVHNNRVPITPKKIYPCWMFVHLSFKSRGLSTWVTDLWALIRFFSHVMWLLSTAQCVLCAVRCHCTVSFLAQVLDTVTYFVSQVLEVATVTYFYIYW